MISVVCVYNNEKIFNSYLLKSLKNQSVEFELIGIDNTSNEFKSAAAALNYGGRKAKNKYIMFAHQDVSFLPNSWLEDTEKLLDSIGSFGIAGVVGMSEIGGSNPKRGRNVIKHGEPPEIWSWGNKIQKPESAQTLDECLVIVPKSNFDILKFDEKTCDGWHLYAVDYCLSVKERGFGVYVLPTEIYHLSKGTSNKKNFKFMNGPLPDDYYVILEKVLKKHADTYKVIYTTCGEWNTAYPVILQRCSILTKAFTHLCNVLK